MDIDNFPNLLESFRKFESNLKSQKTTADRYLDLLSIFEFEGKKARTYNKVYKSLSSK